MTMTFPDRRQASPASRRPEERTRRGSPILFDDAAIAERAAAVPAPPGMWLPPQQLIPAALPDRLPLAFGGQLPDAGDFPLDTVTENMATYPTMPVRWEWGSEDGDMQVLPRDELIVIAAPGGTGKGMLLAAIMAIISRGLPYPYMPPETAAGPGDVIVVAPEDNPITALGPRLDSAGADRSRIHNLTMLASGQRFLLPSALGELQRAIGQFTSPAARRRGANLRAVIIDPIAACVDFQLSSVSRARAVLEPLLLMAQEYGIAIIAAAHTNKDGVTVNGSSAVIDTPRVVWRIERDERNSEIRRIIPHKGNIIAGGARPVQYVIRDDGFGPRAVFINRESVRQQRMGPMMRAAIEYQQANGVHEITDAKRPAITSGRAAITAGPDDAVDRAAAALAGRVGPGWATASDSDRDRYRAAARAMLAAS